MATETDNYKLITPEGNWNFDIENENKNMRVIDKGLVLDVGDSTGTGNNYILDIGSITLNANNKGIAFRFWADKDSTGAVKINTDYNLLKGVGKPVSNLKTGNPYTVVYDGGSNFFLGSGSSVDSDKVTATEKDVLINKTYIGSDEEIHTGSMPERGAVTQNLSANGTITLPEGHYNSVTIKQALKTLAAKTYTPGTKDQIIAAAQYLIGQQIIKGDANLIAANIIAGKSIFGIAGTAPRIKTGTISCTYSERRKVITSVEALGFTPDFFVVCAYTGGSKETSLIAVLWSNAPGYIGNSCNDGSNHPAGNQGQIYKSGTSYYISVDGTSGGKEFTWLAIKRFC